MALVANIRLSAGAMVLARGLLVLVLSALLSSPVASSSSSSSASPGVVPPRARPFAVVGYLPEYRHEGRDWNATCASLTHLLLFSVEVDREANLVALDRLPRPDGDAAIALRDAAARHGTKLLVTLGGAGRANALPLVAADERLRRRLARTLARFCLDRGFHGVDVDWEYPSRPEEWTAHVALLRAVRRAFVETRASPPLVLTAAYHPRGDSERRLRAEAAGRVLDFAHAMSYDFRVEAPRDTLRRASDANVPLTMITVGIPFYATNIRTGATKTYEEVTRDRPRGDEGWAWNDQSAVRAKTREAMEAGAGGVMVWEVGQDLHPTDPKSLLRAVAEEVWPKGRLSPDAERRSDEAKSHAKPEL